MESELSKVTQQFGIIPLWQTLSPQPRGCGLWAVLLGVKSEVVTDHLGLFLAGRPRGAESKQNSESARDHQPVLARAVSVLAVSQPGAFREACRISRH